MRLIDIWNVEAAAAHSTNVAAAAIPDFTVFPDLFHSLLLNPPALVLLGGKYFVACYNKSSYSNS